MVLTTEEAIKQDILQIDKKLIQLLDLRWKMVIITFGVLSAFWGYLIPNIIGANQDGAIYLILSLGFIFSGTLLFFWRFFSHALAAEEKGVLDIRFVNLKLLKDTNLNNYQDDVIRKRCIEIRENELEIQHLSEYLNNNFENFFTSHDELTKSFFKLSPDNRKQLARDIDIEHKNFERGQRRFDKIFGFMIFPFWIVGLLFFFRLQFARRYNELCYNVMDFYLGIWVILILSFVGLCLYYKKYFPPKARPNEVSARIKNLLEQQEREEKIILNPFTEFCNRIIFHLRELFCR